MPFAVTVQYTCTNHCGASEVRKEFLKHVTGIAVYQLPDKAYVHTYISTDDEYRVYSCECFLFVSKY